MNPIILTIIIVISFFLFFKKRVYIQEKGGYILSFSQMAGISGSTNIITKRFIFTIKIESYNRIDEFTEGMKPFRIIEYTGLYGKLTGNNYTIRNFHSEIEHRTSSIKSYNENHEYRKVAYKNKLKTEEKRGLEKGIVITRYEYDSYNRLIRKYEIFNDKEIEQAWYEYDDKNKIIIHKSFLKGKLSSTAKIELKGSKVLLDDKDRLSLYATDWIKETTVDWNNELISIRYFTDGNVEKCEFYHSGKLSSTIIYNPDTGEEISETKHDSDVDEK